MSYPKKFSKSLVKGYRKGGTVDNDSPVYKRTSAGEAKTPAEYNYNLREKFKDTDRDLDLDSSNSARVAADRERAGESTRYMTDQGSFDTDDTKYKTGAGDDYEGYRKGGTVKRKR